MPFDQEEFISPAVPEKAARPDELHHDRERRHAARRFFRAAPPYCIEFDAEGAAVLCERFYEYWPDREPEEATTWRPISRHKDLEEAERRLRLILGAPIYYDTEGRVVSNPPRQRKTRWALPPTDGE
jgi:hypothetical protein